jgi:hypothetical protein
MIGIRVIREFHVPKSQIRERQENVRVDCVIVLNSTIAPSNSLGCSALSRNPVGRALLPVEYRKTTGRSARPTSPQAFAGQCLTRRVSEWFEPAKIRPLAGASC